MTYEEFFRNRQGMGGRLTEQWVDEQIAQISQLPCTGQGPSKKPAFGEDVGIAVALLERGVPLPPDFGCMHCTLLAKYKWVKAAIEAERNSLPVPPMP